MTLKMGNSKGNLTQSKDTLPITMSLSQNRATDVTSPLCATEAQKSTTISFEIDFATVVYIYYQNIDFIQDYTYFLILSKFIGFYARPKKYV